MKKNIIISIVVSIAIVIAMFYFLYERPVSVKIANEEILQPQNVEIRDGVQYVTVTARGGYLPRISIVQPGIPTKLIVQTNGTYDCSASLVVREVGFQKILQPTGKEVIDLGIINKGDTIYGVCSMGMYSFQLKAT